MSEARSAILRGGRQARSAVALRRARANVVRLRRVHGRPVVPRRAQASEAVRLAATQLQAEEMMRAAEEAAQRRGDDAQQAIDTATEAGRAQGYRDGYATGREAGRADLLEALELVRSVASDGKRLRDAILGNSEAQIVRLLVGEIAERHPDLELRAAHEALQQAGNQHILRVRVHPDSKAVLEARYGPTDRDWEVRGDRGIAAGGCIVDTEAGVIDASFDGQVNEIGAAWEELAS